MTNAKSEIAMSSEGVHADCYCCDLEHVKMMTAKAVCTIFGHKVELEFSRTMREIFLSLIVCCAVPL